MTKLWSNSVDSHFLEPEGLWQEILPGALAARLPRSERIGDDEEVVHVDEESFRGHDGYGLPERDVGQRLPSSGGNVRSFPEDAGRAVRRVGSSRQPSDPGRCLQGAVPARERSARVVVGPSCRCSEGFRIPMIGAD